MDRRQFLQRAGMAGALLSLARVPGVVAGSGLVPDLAASSHSAGPDVVRDTFNALAAFVVPGEDPYSVAQGETHGGPGGIEARAGEFLIESLDTYVAQPDQPFANDDTVPLSGGIALMLNNLALQVNPAALAAGPFAAPFANLSSAHKTEVFKRLEALDLGDADAPQPFTASSGNLRFVAGALLEFAAFGSYGEWGVFDGETRTLTETPVGWQLTGYEGPGDGWDEFIGYYQDRTSVEAG